MPPATAAPRIRQRKPRTSPGQRYANGEITLDELREAAHESALRSLTVAPKSRAELGAALSRKGYPAEVVEPLLVRLAEVGLLDDADYAALITRTRFLERGQSRRAIETELRRRGICSTDCKAALAQIDDFAEASVIAELAAKLASRSVGLDQQVRLRRLVAALGRRGYGPEQAYAAAQEALG